MNMMHFLVMAFVVADIVSPAKLPEHKFEQTTQAVTSWAAPTESMTPLQSVETASQSVETAAETVLSSFPGGIIHYRVNGVTPPYEWQLLLYQKLEAAGIAWFYPYSVAQIYQESNWNRWSDNGRDFGLCQQKGIYWADRAAAAGIPGADIWDVHAQIHVYVWMMASYLQAAGGDVGRALSMYYLGTDGWSDTYVGWVLKWLDYLEVVR